MEKHTQGILIVVLGLVLASTALLTMDACFATAPDLFGVAHCTDYGYQGVSLGLGVSAAALIVVGFFVVLAEGGLGLIIRGHPFPPRPGGQAAFGPAYCYACGQPLAWIGPVGRWYCSRCMQYR